MQTADRLLNPELVRYTFVGGAYPIPDRRLVPLERLAQLRDAYSRSVLAFNLPALLDGRADDLRASIRQSYGVSAELAKYAKEFKVYLIGNAHIDIAWLWRMSETQLVARNTFRTVLQNMLEYPELRYAQSQAVTYAWMEEQYPDLFKEIQDRVKDGRWEIVGGMWVEPDCNLIAGESWVRQLLYGKKYFKEKFGVDVRTGWNPDSFGYNWNMPQIYRKSGIDCFITQKIRWNDTTVFPYFIFWWQGADDSRLLTYFPPMSYDSDVQLAEVARAAGTYEAVTGYKKYLILWGLGDHGGGPNREILDRIRGYQGQAIVPELVHAPAGEFLKQIQGDMGDRIPVWGDELYLEYHQGTFTTQGLVKRNNRRAESLLGTTEKLLALNSFYGFGYPREEMEKTWKQVLTHQFHDILPGSSITPVYRDAAAVMGDVVGRLERVIDGELQALAARVDRRGQAGTPVLVYNPLSWPRADLVTVNVTEYSETGARVVDAAGRELPAENRLEKNGSLTVTFVAENVPPIGWKLYWIQSGKPAPPSGEVAVAGLQLETPRHRLVLNSQTGNIQSLFDKNMDREFVPAGQEANRLEIYEDRPENWDAWNIGYTGRQWSLDKADSVEAVNVSPVRATLRVKKSFLGLSKERYSPTEDYPSSFFIQEITLYNKLDRIDVRMWADWWEDHCFLKAAFPVAVSADKATYEIPFAAIQRSTKRETLAEKAKFEVPALRWADLSDPQGGISLLNDCKYGHDIHDGVMRLSLLRSPTWPDPMADRGMHEFTYSLYTHRGGWNDGDTVRRGAELNNPLLAVVTDPERGTVAAESSMFGVEGDGVILETVKPAENGNGLILRLYESKGRLSAATLTLVRKPAGVFSTDLMESPGEAVAFAGTKVSLQFAKFEIKTLLVTFEK
jgi:alpha-mannosidase